jgi:alpha-beta hydrolase superfamily lysophospholipase
LGEPTVHNFTAGDGYTWKYRRYQSAGSPLAEIVGLHGIQSHGEWYKRSCEELAAAGYAVSFLDRRGCGLNVQDRSDAPSFRRLLDDVAEFMRGLPRPRIVCGISWGGKLAVGLQRRHPGLTDALVLIAPGLCPIIRPPRSERIGILVSRFLSPRRQFPIPLNEPQFFTANPAWQSFIRSDPLALREATARLLFESGRMDVYLWFAGRHVTMPVLLLLAGKDRIIDNEATRRLVDRFATAECEVRTFPDAHHTMEFEQGGPPFSRYLLEWIERVSNSCAPATGGLRG